MFKIRPEQMDAFKRAGRLTFENEMVTHSQEFSPRLCEVIEEGQLRVAIRQTIANAEQYGFDKRGPIRLCIELMFLAGSGFDSDPLFPVLGEILNDRSDQMERAERIYDQIVDYQEAVCGPKNINVRRSLEYLAELAGQPVEFSAKTFESQALQEMRNAFPQRVAYVGEEALKNLIREGRAKAKRYGFNSHRAEALMIVSMFAFGHGCDNDSLYPWISRTLNDERITDSSKRAKRLERKSATWLRHVLARNGGVSS